MSVVEVKQIEPQTKDNEVLGCIQILIKRENGNQNSFEPHYEEYIPNGEVPLWKKLTMTVEEAAQYSGIGINKIRALSNNSNCPFVLWNGKKRHIKRKEFEKYLSEEFSI